MNDFFCIDEKEIQQRKWKRRKREVHEMSRSKPTMDEEEHVVVLLHLLPAELWKQTLQFASKKETYRLSFICPPSREMRRLTARYSRYYGRGRGEREKSCSIRDDILERHAFLTSIDVRCAGLDTDTMISLCSGIACCRKLKKLDVSGNPKMRSPGLCALAKALLSCDALECLSTSLNLRKLIGGRRRIQSFWNDGFSALLDTLPSLPHLKDLSMNFGISETHVQRLALCTRLEKLNLSMSIISCRGCVELIKVIPRWENLVSFVFSHLCFNCPKDGVVPALMDSLSSCEKLQVLDLSNNQNYCKIGSVYRCLKKLRFLATLDLHGNNVDLGPYPDIAPTYFPREFPNLKFLSLRGQRRDFSENIVVLRDPDTTIFLL